MFRTAEEPPGINGGNTMAYQTVNPYDNQIVAAFDDFTAIGDFEIISAPSQVTPVPEEQSGQVIVVLRRPRGVTAPSGPKLPPPAPTSGSAGSGMGTGL